jgi:hypothetical protein
MIRGVFAFVAALMLALAQPQTRSWYRRALLRSFAASLVILVFLLGSGYWAAGAFFSESWQTGLVAFAWTLAVLFLAGRITAAASGLFAGVWVDEKGLASCFLGERAVNLPGARWNDRARELMASSRNVLLSVALAPLFFFPLLLPFAVFLLAWGFGREAIAFGRRLSRQASLPGSDFEEGAFPASFALGLGLLPAFASLLPLVGWTVWPLLQIAGVATFAAPTGGPSFSGFRGAGPSR